MCAGLPQPGRFGRADNRVTVRFCWPLSARKSCLAARPARKHAVLTGYSSQRGLMRQHQLAVAPSSSSAKPRVMLGSTGTPGPIVVVKVTFLRYRPLAAAGLSLTTSSIAAA